MRVPGVLFLPDLGYDHRIWADLVASFDPGPVDGPAVVAAGWAAGRAVQAALAGRAGGLVLFQPVPDHLPPEAVEADAETDLLWLEDRAGARSVIEDMLLRMVR
jgi:hypothetical protein